MILYHTSDVKMPVFPKRKISAWIKTIAAKHEKKVGDIAYIFCSDAKILELNKQYLSHDFYTDIITFDYLPHGEAKDNKPIRRTQVEISGDLFISIETVRSNAEKYAVPYETELFRVMIHGILHLCGINDKTPAARAQMKHFENEALNNLLL